MLRLRTIPTRLFWTILVLQLMQCSFGEKNTDQGASGMDTINEEFFASDSLMTADDCIPFTEHYPNGAIKLKGCQGHFGPFGVPIGTWTYYDSTGSMILKENYFHDMDSGYVRKEIFIAGQVSITYNIRYDPHYGELEDTLQVY